MMHPNSSEIQSRARIERFLAEAEQDHMAQLARSAWSGQTSQRLRSRIAELLVMVAVRLEPALLLYYEGSRAEPRVRVARH